VNPSAISIVADRGIKIKGRSMTEEIRKSIRYRVNVSTSVKGVKTWDCTCDAEGFTMDDVLEESDKLVAELEKRYPLQLPEGG